jgi:hypothetical protein
MRSVKKMVLLVCTLSLVAVLFQNCANFGENFGAFMGGANGAMERNAKDETTYAKVPVEPSPKKINCESSGNENTTYTECREY